MWNKSLVTHMALYIKCLVHICPGRRAINLSDFPCDFFGLVGGYGLQHVFTLSTGIFLRFLLRGLGGGGGGGGNPGLIRTETVRRFYGNCAMSVQLPCSLRTEIVRSPCGDQPSHGARAGIVQCHLRQVYGLRSYDFSKFVKLLAKPNRRGHGARESVQKSHSRLLPPQGGLTERGIQAPQAKCELGKLGLYFPSSQGLV